MACTYIHTRNIDRTTSILVTLPYMPHTLVTVSKNIHFLSGSEVFAIPFASNPVSQTAQDDYYVEGLTTDVDKTFNVVE